MTESTRTCDLTHVLPSQTHFMWGLAESRGGLYSSHFTGENEPGIKGELSMGFFFIIAFMIYLTVMLLNIRPF